MYSIYIKVDVYFDFFLVIEVSVEIMDSYIYLKKIREVVILFLNLFR